MYTDLEHTSAELYTRFRTERTKTISRGRVKRVATPPPPFGDVFDLSGYPCLALFHTKNNIINSQCFMRKGGWLTDRHLRENKPSGLEGPEMILHTCTFVSTWCSRLKMLSQRSIVYLRIEKLDLTPTHVCVLICHAWWKSLSHYSINWHILKNILII